MAEHDYFSKTKRIYLFNFNNKGWKRRKLGVRGFLGFYNIPRLSKRFFPPLCFVE